MGDTLRDEQRRILKLGQILKNLNLSHSSKLLLADADPSQFTELFFNTLDDVNKLSKFLLLPECQIDKQNVFKTLQAFLEQQQITGNIKEDLDEFTRYVALDSAFSQLMTLRMCFWRDPTVKHNYDIYAIGQALELKESEPVKILESASKKIEEMKPSLPLHCIEPIVTSSISTEHHARFDEINTHFKEEYARLKLRYVESFDRSFRDMMSGVSTKHEKYQRVQQERARIKIESSFSLWDTYNARWDLVTDLSRCAVRRRVHQRPKGKVTTTTISSNNPNEESSVKTYVENIPVEHVVTKGQMKYAKLQQAKQKKKDQKKRRKLKELGLLDTEEEKKAEFAGEDNEHEERHDDDGDDDNDGDDNEENKEDEPQPLESKKKNRNKSEKQERRLKKKSKKEARAAPGPANNTNVAPLPKEEPAVVTKAEKKKQKFVVVVGDDGGVDVGEKN